MKKFVGTSIGEVNMYLLDCFSIAHFICGLIAYYISFWLFYTFFMDTLPSIFLSYICSLIGGIIWEFAENTSLVQMKRNKRVDIPINSLMDVMLVFFGSILGAFTYHLWLELWIFNIILLGILFVMYGITRILTEKNL